jgi:prepilin-type N-terminal cleavage/methylation domain-containing protein
MPIVSSQPKLGAGFTLAEILITVALIAVLMALAVPAMQGVRERAAFARGRAELTLIAQALESYRRAYGDYPQTGDFSQASPMLEQPLSTNHAQAKLFNALGGVFGPTAFAASDREDGPAFLETSTLTLETSSALLSNTDESQSKSEICAAPLDPWGRRYLYYYKKASAATAWTASGYWLYSAGPDGRHQPPDTASGAASAQGSENANADNLWGSAPR